MMPVDPLGHVKPGERLDIHASTWNALMDTVRAVRRLLSETGRGDSEASTKQSDTIRVRNDTGEAQSRFAVLGLDAPLILPTENMTEFSNQVMFSGIAPTYRGRFAVLIEPIPNGAIGKAVIGGVVPVLMSGAQYDFAEIASGQTGYLANASFGSARVLWADGPSSGLGWAIVRLGDPGSDLGSSSDGPDANFGPGGTATYFETDIACEAGTLNVYTREVSIILENGVLSQTVGEWEFDHSAGCCDCADSSGSSSGGSSSGGPVIPSELPCTYCGSDVTPTVVHVEPSGFTGSFTGMNTFQNLAQTDSCVWLSELFPSGSTTYRWRYRTDSATSRELDLIQTSPPGVIGRWLLVVPSNTCPWPITLTRTIDPGDSPLTIVVDAG